MSNPGIRLDGFCDPVRSSEVFGRGHGNLGPEGAGLLLNAGIISGDEEKIQLVALLHPLKYMPQQAFACEEMEGFSGEARGSPSGGDNTSDLSCRSLCRHLDE